MSIEDGERTTGGGGGGKSGMATAGDKGDMRGDGDAEDVCRAPGLGEGWDCESCDDGDGGTPFCMGS